MSSWVEPFLTSLSFQVEIGWHHYSLFMTPEMRFPYSKLPYFPVYRVLDAAIGGPVSFVPAHRALCIIHDKMQPWSPWLPGRCNTFIIYDRSVWLPCFNFGFLVAGS